MLRQVHPDLVRHLTILSLRPVCPELIRRPLMRVLRAPHADLVLHLRVLMFRRLRRNHLQHVTILSLPQDLWCRPDPSRRHHSVYFSAAPFLSPSTQFQFLKHVF